MSKMSEVHQDMMAAKYTNMDIRTFSRMSNEEKYIMVKEETEKRNHDEQLI